MLVPSAELKARIANPDAEKTKLDKISDQHDQILAQTIATTKVKAPALVGASVNFSPEKIGMNQALTYGTKVFGRNGFDVYRDNTKYYKQNTTATEEFMRAAEGMGKLAKIGFQDTIGLGLFADKHNYKAFGDTMRDYSSFKGGNQGFWANTMLSSGYTMGIIGAIAAEELAIGVATGGIGAIGGATTIGTRLARGSEHVGETLNQLDNLSDINQARSFWNGSAGSFIKGLANPLENTSQFVKAIKAPNDLNKLKKVALGAGALVRDARAMTMTHGESKLEADMNYDEYQKEAIASWNKNNKDKTMDDATLASINHGAQRARDLTYKSNLGLIYLTNKITFDNMFNSMKAVNKFDNLFNGLVRYNKGTFSVAKGKNLITSKLKNIGLDIANTVTTKKGFTKALGKFGHKVVTNSMEGVQEVGQDIINQASKRQSNAEVHKQVNGNQYSTLLDSFIAATEDTMSNSETLSTFLSGALMGTFASPVGAATGFATRAITQKNYLKDLAQPIVNYKEWIKSKHTLYEKAEKQSELLNKVFDVTKNFESIADSPLARQAAIQDQLHEAAAKGDMNAYHNLVNDATSLGAQTLFQNDVHGQYIEHLEYLRDKLNATELGEAFNRTDITEANHKEHQQKITDKIEAIKNLRNVYDNIQDTMLNPYVLEGADSNDEQYDELVNNHIAFENLKKEALFSHALISDRTKRMQILKEEVSKNSGLDDITTHALFDKTQLTTQIELLNAQIKANSELTSTPKIAAELEQAKIKKAALEKYQKASQYLFNNRKGKNSAGLNKAHDQLVEAYVELAHINNPSLSKEELRSISNATIAKIFDYSSMDAEQKAVQSHVDFLTTPDLQAKLFEQERAKIENNKANRQQQIKDSLLTLQNKAMSDAMLADLLDNGYFFDLKELDNLLENGVMPSVIYDAEGKIKVNKEEYLKAQEIINKHYENLTGKSVQSSKNYHKNSLRKKGDVRTTKDITSAYDITLNQDHDIVEIIDDMLENENLVYSDRMLLEEVGDQTGTVKFITTGEQPFSIDKDGNFIIDLSFSGTDFKHHSISFENLVVSALLFKRIQAQLKENPELQKEADALLKLAQEAFNKETGLEASELPALENTVTFLVEAMTNAQFQEFLSEQTDIASPDEDSLWKSFTNFLKQVLKELNFSNTMLGNATALATKVINTRTTDTLTTEEAGDNTSVDTPVTTTVDTNAITPTTPTPSTVSTQNLGGQTMITITTPFAEFPKELQDRLARSLFKKNADKLKAKEIQAIQTFLQSDSTVQQILYDYNKEIIDLEIVTQPTAENFENFNFSDASNQLDNILIENHPDDTVSDRYALDAIFSMFDLASLSEDEKLDVYNKYLQHQITEEEILNILRAKNFEKFSQQANASWKVFNGMTTATIKVKFTNKKGEEDFKYVGAKLGSANKAFIASYHYNELLILNPNEVDKFVYDLLTGTSKRNIATDFNSLQEAKVLVNDLLKKKQLYSLQLRKINLKLIELDIPFQFSMKKFRGSLDSVVAVPTSKTARTQKVVKEENAPAAKKFLQSIVVSGDQSTSERRARAIIALHFLNGGKVHPEAVSKRHGKKYFTSSQSTFKTFDGLANHIFEDYPEFDAVRMSDHIGYVEAMMRDYKSGKEMAQALYDKWATQEEEEDTNDQFTQEDLDYQALGLNESAQDFVSTDEFMVLNGEYNGKYEDLTDRFKSIYNYAKKYKEHYQTTGAQEKQEDIIIVSPEIDNSFEAGLNVQQDEIDVAYNSLMKFFNQNLDMKNFYIPYGKMKDRVMNFINQENITAGKILTVDELLAIDRVISIHGTQTQKDTMAPIIARALPKANYNPDTIYVLNLKGKTEIVRINMSTKGIYFTDHATNAPIKLHATEFVEAVTTTVKPGDVIINNKVDTLAEAQNIEYIKESYNQFFSTFDEIPDSIESLNDKIIEQLTKCK